MLIVALAGSLCVALSIWGAAAWIHMRGGDTEAGRTDRLSVLDASFGQGISPVGEPTRDWFVSIDDLLPDATVAPLEYREGSNAPELIGFDDRVVGVATQWDEDTETQREVTFGIDADDGSIVWTRSDLSPTCAAVNLDRLLVCQRAGDRPGLVLVDPEDGSDLASSDLPPYAATLLEHDGTLYALNLNAPDSDQRLSVTAYALPNLTKQWTTALDTTIVECCHGDFALEVDGNDLTAYWINALWRIDRRSGEVLEADGSPGWRLHGDHTILTSSDDTGRTSFTHISDASGRTVAGNDGSLWFDLGGEVAAMGRVGIGDTLFDLGSGEALWTTPTVYGDRSARWSHDLTHVIVEDWDVGSTIVLDAEDGAVLAEVSGTHVDAELRFAGEVALSAPSSGHELRAYDLRTGEPAWSRDISAVDAYFDADIPNLHGVTAVGRTIAVAGEDGIAGFTGFPHSDRDSRGNDTSGVALTTACGRPPEFVPVATALSGGGITITYEVHAVCPGGQWLNWSQLRVPITVDGNTYTDGYFDFSRTPYWITDPDSDDDRTRLRLTYGFADATVPYDDIAEAIESDGGSGTVVVVPCEPGPANTEDAPVPADPAYGGDPDEAIGSSGGPDTGDPQESALEALQRIAAEDRDTVAGLEWTAQLSSKRPGTYDDGRVYDSYDDILALHLEYRARYPDSLLAWSNDWPGSFGPSSKDYWITLGGQSESATIPILDWCRDEGWGDGDCWAKRLLTTGNPDKESRHKDSSPPDPSKN